MSSSASHYSLCGAECRLEHINRRISGPRSRTWPDLAPWVRNYRHLSEHLDIRSGEMLARSRRAYTLLNFGPAEESHQSQRFRALIALFELRILG